MRLNATCPCGATFSYECADGKDVYLTAGGAPDEKGRVFAIQVQFDRWHEAHKDHKASITKEFFK